MVHRQPARRRVHRGRRRREDKPAVLQQGRADREDLVLRPVGHESRQTTPFTLDKFDEFFRLLPKRGDSERSWTVDFVARKKKATEEAAPFKTAGTAKEQEANRWKEQLAELKKAKPRQRRKSPKPSSGSPN